MTVSSQPSSADSALAAGESQRSAHIVKAAPLGIERLLLGQCHHSGQSRRDLPSVAAAASEFHPIVGRGDQPVGASATSRAGDKLLRFAAVAEGFGPDKCLICHS
jgi:hypothetical protein